MRFASLAMALSLAFVASSCSSGTSGGPGATPPKKTSVTDSLPSTQSKDTFSLDVPNLATKLKRGEAKDTSITVKRGANMMQDVKITFDGLPNGVSIAPDSISVTGTNTEAKLTVKATNDAPIGDFVVKVTGHPTSGQDATNTMKVSVSER